MRGSALEGAWQRVSDTADPTHGAPCRDTVALTQRLGLAGGRRAPSVLEASVALAYLS